MSVAAPGNGLNRVCPRAGPFWLGFGAPFVFAPAGFLGLGGAFFITSGFAAGLFFLMTGFVAAPLGFGPEGGVGVEFILIAVNVTNSRDRELFGAPK